MLGWVVMVYYLDIIADLNNMALKLAFVYLPIPLANTLTSNSKAASQVVKHLQPTMFEVSVTTF